MKFLSGLQDVANLFERCNPKLALIVSDADYFCRSEFNKHFIITSLIRPQTNDSGVHAAGRACDGRIKNPVNGDWYLSEAEQIKLCQYLNKKYPYGNGKLTAMIHNHGEKTIRPTAERPIFVSPTSTAPHIHIQVPA